MKPVTKHTHPVLLLRQYHQRGAELSQHVCHECLREQRVLLQRLTRLRCSHKETAGAGAGEIRLFTRFEPHIEVGPASVIQSATKALACGKFEPATHAATSSSCSSTDTVVSNSIRGMVMNRHLHHLRRASCEPIRTAFNTRAHL